MKRLLPIVLFTLLPLMVKAEIRFHTMPGGSYYGGIHSIARDSTGRIWFSGYDAVYAFDGDRFISMTEKVMSQDPALVWTFGFLTQDHSGRLYLATNHGLQRYNCANDVFECIAQGNIGKIESTNDGTVWFICNGDLCSVETDSRPSGQPAFPQGSRETILWQLPKDMDKDPRKLSLNCSGNHVWTASEGDLYRREISGEYTHFKDFGKTSIADVLEKKDTVFVLTLSEGLYICAPDGEIMDRFTLPILNDKASTAKQLYRDHNGTIWVATQYGLMMVSPGSGKVELLRTRPSHPYTLPNNSVWSFFPDGDDRIWIGTYGGKLALAVRGDSDVDTYLNASFGGLGHPIVSCFTQDLQGRIWIGTEGGGITVWDRQRDTFTYFSQQDGSGLASNMIKKLSLGDDGRVWASFFNSGIQVFDPRKAKWKDIPLTRGPKDSPLSIYDFLPDGKGGLWMSDPDSDLMHASLTSGKIEIIRGDRRRQVESVFRDRKGRLWIISHVGAHNLDPNSGEVIKSYIIPDSPYAVNCLCCALVTSGGEIVFGTKGAGINILGADGSYKNYPMDGRTVFSMEEDPATGCIWMGTDNGLYVLENGKITQSSLNTPSHCGPFYPRASFCTREGELLFGGSDGLILFRPSSLIPDSHKPKVFFTGLRINNEPVPNQVFAAPRTPLKLKHSQQNISISFSSDSYLRSWNNRFSYRIKGFSNQWRTLPAGQKALNIFNLSPGSYVFQIKAFNSDGLEGDHIAQLSWVIKPSPFRTWYAYLIYISAVIGIIILVWRFFTNRRLYKQELELEKERENNMRELTKARIKFFTNISHDLKTPLALIVDPLSKLKEHLTEDSPANKYATLIEKNVGRIQRMITQLLTFREIESDRLTLNRRPGDLIGFLKSLFSLFEPYADRKGIEMLFHSQFEQYNAFFDHEVVEKVFTNVFSNAVKYTTLPGSISVNIREASPENIPGPEKDGWISISISNTGADISPERRERLFDAFNHDNSAVPDFESSSGLGLAIVKELINKTGGNVKVESANSLVTFTVTSRFSRTAQKAEEDMSGAYNIAESEVESLIEELNVRDDSAKRPRKSTTVLVIDDDSELRTYIEAHLSGRYNVYTASNGLEGLEKVERVSPQIIITDLMMEGADGFEVCRTLRGSLTSSHIPIIVLSGDADAKVKAIESGANVFIEKPFSMDYLLSQVEGLLRIQAEMRDYYSKKYVVEPSKLVISSMDEAILSRAMECIERNMDNNDYDVDEFVFDMAMGRTILYRKLKDITGMSIKEFILDIRLKRAAQLLLESDLTVSEISDRTGFVNPKYFSVCFKRRFDTSPTDFKKQENAQ